MTRTEFVKGYAERSGMSSEWASLGIIKIGDHEHFALPCGNCGDEECQGWAIVSSNSAIDHLFFNAPDGLLSAYREAVRQAGGE